MQNPLTREVESYMGGTMVLLFTGFCVMLIFIAMKNFDSELTVMNAHQVRLKTVSPTQRRLMDAWVQSNNIQVPETEGYRWLLDQYPSRPWNE